MFQAPAPVMQPPTIPYASMQPAVMQHAVMQHAVMQPAMMPQVMATPTTYSYTPSVPDSNMNQFRQYMQEKQEEYFRRVYKNEN